VEAKIVTSRRSQKPVTTSIASVSARRPATKSTILPRNDPVSLSFGWPIPNLDIRLPLDQDEVCICFVRRHLLPNGPIDLGLQGLQSSEIFAISWLVIVNDAPVFAQAILSFATLFFGAQHHQNQIVVKGYAMHDVALRSLNHVLGTPGCHLRDDVLVSVVTLAILEAYVPSGPRNYLKHLRGLERLLELRDPASLKDCSYKTLCLYKGIRHMILFASLRNRTPSILARAEWKSALRTDLSLEEPMEQDVFSILADCSVLVAASDGVEMSRHTHGQSFSKRQAQVECRAMELLMSLLAWKSRWDTDQRNIYIEDHDVPAKSIDSVPAPVSSIYRFKSDMVGRMFMLYNTALCCILSLLPSTPSSQPEPFVASSFSQADIQISILNGDYRTASRHAGLDVARTITDYRLHKRSRGEMDFTSLAFQWAVAEAWKVLGGNDTAEGRWIMGLLDGEGNFSLAKAAWEM
jgi:hypothetical protein